MKYKVLRRFRDDRSGIWYSVGDTFETDAERGKALCAEENPVIEKPKKAKAKEQVEEQ